MAQSGGACGVGGYVYQFVQARVSGVAALLAVLGVLFVVLGFLSHWLFLVFGVVAVAVGLAAARVPGDLTVTWRRADPIKAPPVPPGPASVPPTAQDPGEQLRSLRRLLDDGLIGQADYDAKKSELLARM